MSVAEQRYLAVLAVIAEGHTVKDVAARWGVPQQTVHSWLSRYKAGGLEGLRVSGHAKAIHHNRMTGGDDKHRPRFG